MKWNDLKQLEALLLKTEKQGAIIKEIGKSGQQQPIYSVTVGDKNLDRIIVAIAGMHASEVIGQLALVDLISKLNSENTQRLQYHFVPVADPDLLAENVNQLSEPITLSKLLSLKAVRDLEGYFTSNRYPECEAIRQWLETFPRIDAFFSLHTAPVAPGLFFYVAGKSNDCIAFVADRTATICQPFQIPLLEKDPTGDSQKALFPGFFTVPTAVELNSRDRRDRSGTSIEFVTKKFQPSFLGVSEIPLGICTGLHDAPIEKIESFNKQLAQNTKLFYVNTLYIDTGEHKILIDSGAGRFFGNNAGYMAQNLTSAGIDPDSIDMILITHAHTDHIGGLISADGSLTYPNAEYYISQSEWDFWTDPQVSLPNSLFDAKTKEFMIKGVQQTLSLIKNKTKFFEFETEIIPGIIATDTSGHTPGHTSYLIASEQEKLIATGDVFFSDPLDLEHPDWEVASDTDYKKGLAIRTEFLEEVSQSRVELLVPHMPFPGLGHVNAEEDRYSWKPSWWKFDSAS